MSRPGLSLDSPFEKSSDPAFVIDPLDDRFVDANAAGCDLLGYTREELLDTPVSRIHPGELEQLQAFVSRVLEQRHGSTITLACRIRRGNRLPIELSLWGVRERRADPAARPRRRPKRAPPPADRRLRRHSGPEQASAPLLR